MYNSKIVAQRRRPIYTINTRVQDGGNGGILSAEKCIGRYDCPGLLLYGRSMFVMSIDNLVAARIPTSYQVPKRKHSLYDKWQVGICKCCPHPPRVNCKNVPIGWRYNARVSKCLKFSVLIQKCVPNSQDDLFFRHSGRNRFSILKLGHSVGTLSLSGRDGLDPHLPFIAVKVELRTFSRSPVKGEPAIEHRYTYIHFPESFLKMIPSIGQEVSVCVGVILLPEAFDERAILRETRIVTNVDVSCVVICTRLKKRRSRHTVDA